MLWVLPQFFSRNKNLVYPYLVKKGCDENGEAKSSGKLLDPIVPLLYLLSSLSFLWALGWAEMWLLFVQQMDDAVTKAFRRNWFCFRL